MAANIGLAGVLYIDGHVNLFYGHTTNMPKRFTSWLRLRMSGSNDYCLPDCIIQAGVNDKTSQPFFVVNEAINSGMIGHIKTTILPRLEAEVPKQATAEELQKNSQLYKLMIVCDRKYYSVEFFQYLREKRVAIWTYNKNIKDKWQEEDFKEYETIDEDGTKEKLKQSKK